MTNQRRRVYGSGYILLCRISVKKGEGHACGEIERARAYLLSLNGLVGGNLAEGGGHSRFMGALYISISTRNNATLHTEVFVCLVQTLAHMCERACVIL